MSRRGVWIAGQNLAGGSNALLRNGRAFGAVGGKFAQIKTSTGKAPSGFRVVRLLFVLREGFCVAALRVGYRIACQGRSDGGVVSGVRQQRGADAQPKQEGDARGETRPA